MLQTLLGINVENQNPNLLQPMHTPTIATKPASVAKTGPKKTASSSQGKGKEKGKYVVSLAYKNMKSFDKLKADAVMEHPEDWEGLDSWLGKVKDIRRIEEKEKVFNELTAREEFVWDQERKVDKATEEFNARSKNCCCQSFSRSEEIESKRTEEKRVRIQRDGDFEKQRAKWNAYEVKEQARLDKEQERLDLCGEITEAEQEAEQKVKDQWAEQIKSSISDIVEHTRAEAAARTAEADARTAEAEAREAEAEADESRAELEESRAEIEVDFQKKKRFLEEIHARNKEQVDELTRLRQVKKKRKHVHVLAS